MSAILFVGLPGCGKTVAAKAAKETVENHSYRTATYKELSDYVRYEYGARHGSERVDDNSLGEWAAKMKEKHGNGYFARGVAETLVGDDTVVIAGVRSPDEADAFRDVYDDVTIIPIWTLPDERYVRLEEREGEYTHEEFNERKQRELWDWNCIKFFMDEDYYDYIVPNNYSQSRFETDISYLVDATIHGEEPPLYTESPFDDFSKETVSQYL